MKQMVLLVLMGLPGWSHAYEFSRPDWSESAVLAQGPRSNPYLLNEEEFARARKAGLRHALWYPVTPTGLLPPLEPVKKFLESKTYNPFKWALKKVFKGLFDVKSIDDVFEWVGMHEYPQSEGSGVFYVPFANGKRPDTPMGLTLMKRNGATGLTISCAECHAGKLFGKTILGMTNRFPRANEAFFRAGQASKYYDSRAFQKLTKATDQEMDLLDSSMVNLRSVGLQKPLSLGLDTSLAQVALSLNKRNPDAFATKNPHLEKHPTPDDLDHNPADSKPAVWWNLKYKTRWLSDGSVASGNPIFTNILWNEIGRGSDLSEIETWLQKNENTIVELTSAAFSVEAPKWTDFFPPESIDVSKARAGESVFNQRCAHCHGHYEKQWDHEDPKERLFTTRVLYHQKTPVINVGTDPFRRLGMKSLEKLNRLKISKENETFIQVQSGYVPPPLVGIWARWPYFHNNSIPNLCELLKPSKKRIKKFYSGEADSPGHDFDSQCIGYPTGKNTPKHWKTQLHLVDTNRSGLSNVGHDEGIFLKDGVELLSSLDKQSLLEYLKTL